jgi:selenocysteine lyase/cysteine desulfurase
VSFGMNMTSLNFALSRALSADWVPGDEVVVTRLDHDANVSPWLRAAADRGATVQWVPFDTDTYRLDLDQLAEVVGPRTRVVAITHASNAIGTIVDIAAATQIAHDAGALIVVAPSTSPPTASSTWPPQTVTSCSLLPTSSSGRISGSGRAQLAPREARRVSSPACSRFRTGQVETGTQSFEALAGVTAAIDHLASLAQGEASRRERLIDAFGGIAEHATGLGRRFLDGLPDSATVFGITDDLGARTPTYAIELDGFSARRLATELGDRGIYVTDGNYYAVEVMSSLRRADGGLVRIGFLHYTTDDEVDRLLEALHYLAGHG